MRNQLHNLLRDLNQLSGFLHGRKLFLWLLIRDIDLEQLFLEMAVSPISSPVF